MLCGSIYTHNLFSQQMTSTSFRQYKDSALNHILCFDSGNPTMYIALKLLTDILITTPGKNLFM